MNNTTTHNIFTRFTTFDGTLIWVIGVPVTFNFGFLEEKTMVSSLAHKNSKISLFGAKSSTFQQKQT